MKVALLAWVFVASAVSGCGKKDGTAPTSGVPVTGTDAATPPATAPAPGPDAGTSAPAPDAAATSPAPTVAPTAPAPDAATAATTAADGAGANAGDAAPTPSDAAIATGDAGDAGTVIDRELTPEKYAELLQAMAACKLIGSTIDPKCTYQNSLRDWLAKAKRSPDFEAKSRAVTVALLADKSPILRVKGAELVVNMMRKGDDAKAVRDALVAAYQKEEVGQVKAAFVRTLGGSASFDEEIAALLFKALEDKDVDVRGQAIYAVASPRNKGLEGVAGKLMKVADKDSDLNVRQVACENAGRLGDEAILAKMTELTGDKAPPELAASCMTGLVAMWADAPRFENASEKAYKLTLNLLDRKPRNKHMPSWVAIGRIGKIGVVSHDEKDKDARKEQWKNRVRKWYNPNVVRTALKGIVLDLEAEDKTAAQALETVAELGEKRASLVALQAQLVNTKRAEAKSPVAAMFRRLLDNEVDPKDDKPSEPEGKPLPGQTKLERLPKRPMKLPKDLPKDLPKKQP